METRLPPPGRVAALRRHPVKGFTPEPLPEARLQAGRPFPADRLWAVENGPSGFDPAAPAHVPKQRFAVLAPIPAVARVRTRYDAATAGLEASAPGAEPFHASLGEAAGRDAFAAWLAPVLDAADPEARRGPLKVVGAPGWRFFDDQKGPVSLLNLASVRDLETRMGAALDPERFRANLWVEGWPAWAELALPAGAAVHVGGAVLEMVKPIRRCTATHVDPATGVRDREVVAALQAGYGHAFCGVYLRVTGDGRVATGDSAHAAP